DRDPLVPAHERSERKLAASVARPFSSGRGTLGAPGGGARAPLQGGGGAPLVTEFAGVRAGEAFALLSSRERNDAMRMIVADHDSESLELIRRVATARGHEVVACRDGHEASRALEKGASVLVAAWDLRGVNGPTLCR